MKKFSLKYGKGIKEINIDSSIDVKIVEGKKIDDDKDEASIVKNALMNPIDSPRLMDIVKPGDKICIVVSDTTRLWQKQYFYLPFIVDELESAGINDKDIIFICALGTHRKQTEEEHRMILGDELYKRFKIIDHDCMDKSNLVYIGTTSFNTPVKINKIAADCSHIILTGGIVFHDMAGFGGGRKSILPGISAYDTIMANHALSMNPRGHGCNPAVKTGVLSGNPFSDDMIEAAKLAKPSFLFNVLVNPEGKIYAAVAGNFITAHEEGCKILKDTDGAEIESRADLVIASCGGYPKDIDLYQASKALTNARGAAKPGATIMLVAECPEGLGHSEMEYIINNFKNNYEREKELKESYTVAKYTGYLICEIAEKYNVIIVSDLNSSNLKNCNFKFFKSLQKAYDSLNKDTIHTACILPSGGNTLPCCTK